MMKKSMIALLCILSLMMSVVGCSKKVNKDGSNVGSKGTDKTGRYVEKTIEEPQMQENEKMLAVIKNNEGKLEYYTQVMADYTTEKIHCYTKTEDGYEKTEAIWAKDALDARVGDISKLFLGQDGHYYLLFEMFEVSTDMEGYTIKSTLFQSADDLLSCNNVTPAKWNEAGENEFGTTGTSVNSIEVTKNGLLIHQINFDPTIRIYSLEEQKEIELENNQSTNYDYEVVDHTIYYISEDSTELVVFDYSTKKEKRIALDSVDSQVKLQIASDGTIFLLDTAGIHRYQVTGTLWEIIADGSIYSMSIPSYVPVDFIYLQGSYDRFVVYYDSQIESRSGFLADYSFDETVPASFEKEITVYSLWDNTTIRQAISNYMKEHTNVRINYVVALSEDSSATLSDQIRALNTEVLAGKGADIFLLDGLPMESFIQKGVLMDIGEVLNPLMEQNLFLPQISDDYVLDSKIYGMPIRFYVPVYATSQEFKEQTQSISELADYASTSERKLMDAYSYKDLLSMFLYTYGAEFMKEDQIIDSEALKEFLQHIKVIAEQIESTKEPTKEFNIAISGIASNQSSIQNFIHGNEIEIVLSDVCSTMGYAGNLHNFDMIQACSKEAGGSFFPVKDIYVPNGIVGINKATKEVEVAKDFVSELFKDVIQSLDLNDGFPVNSDSLKAWLTKEVKGEMMSSLAIADDAGQVHNITFSDMSKEEKQKVYDMILSLDTPVTNNTILMDMIIEEGVSYLAGEKDINQAVSDITSKVNLYLNE